MASPNVSTAVGDDQWGPGGVSPDHLLDCAHASRRVLEALVERDWAVPAGDLAWDVRTTIAHTIDALGWYAAHLAAQSPDRLLVDFQAHREASNGHLLDIFTAAAAMLAQVARAAPRGARAYHVAGMADTSGILALGCDEVLVHTWDASRGLGADFAPTEDMATPVLRRLFPWVGFDTTSWQCLLWANGRMDLPGQPPSPGAAWVSHSAPLDEWDGAVPAPVTNPPRRYRWDESSRRWIGAW